MFLKVCRYFASYFYLLCNFPKNISSQSALSVFGFEKRSRLVQPCRILHLMNHSVFHPHSNTGEDLGPLLVEYASISTKWIKFEIKCFNLIDYYSINKHYLYYFSLVRFLKRIWRLHAHWCLILCEGLDVNFENNQSTVCQVFSSVGRC